MSIETGIVGIAPEELNRIVSNGHVVNSVNADRHRRGVKSCRPGPLVYALGARATQAKLSAGVYAAVPVLPLNGYGSGIELHRLGRRLIVQWLPFLASCRVCYRHILLYQSRLTIQTRRVVCAPERRG